MTEIDYFISDLTLPPTQILETSSNSDHMPIKSIIRFNGVRRLTEWMPTIKRGTTDQTLIKELYDSKDWPRIQFDKSYGVKKYFI